MNRKTLLLSALLCLAIFSAACQTATPSTRAGTAAPTSSLQSPTEVPTRPPTDSTSPTSSPTVLPGLTAVPPTEMETGSISGKIGYPAETVPAMRIFAYRIGTGAYYAIETQLGQSDYQMEGLAEGSYYVVGFTIGDNSFPEGFKQGYTAAVICGLSESCTDHRLAEVSVAPGQMTEGVDLTDGLVSEGNTPAHSLIEGSLSYPSEFIPPMRVVAFRLEDGRSFYVNTQMNQGQYVLPVPAGTYHVVAYVGGVDASSESLPAGYSQAVLCGLSVDCTDHSLVDVVVEQGLGTIQIDPGDWYAPAGSFPMLP